MQSKHSTESVAATKRDECAVYVEGACCQLLSLLPKKMELCPLETLLLACVCLLYQLWTRIYRSQGWCICLWKLLRSNATC